MTGLDRVLVPLDGSTRAEVALRWVPILPASHVRLLRVCDGSNSEHAAALRYLEEVTGRLGQLDCVVEPRVLIGCPADAIVGDATDRDVIVMCTLGAGGGGRLLYGSVADLVARHAPVPTLLLRGGNHPVSEAPVHRVVVPLDGSENARRSLPFAVILAQLMDATIHLITVTGPAGTAGAADETRLQQEAESLRARDVAASIETRSGEPTVELLGAVAAGDLLVITTHGRGLARRWQIGRVAEKLLRQAEAPVVLIRADSLPNA